MQRILVLVVWLLTFKGIRVHTVIFVYSFTVFHFSFDNLEITHSLRKLGAVMSTQTLRYVTHVHHALGALKVVWSFTGGISPYWFSTYLKLMYVTLCTQHCRGWGGMDENSSIFNLFNDCTWQEDKITGMP